MDAEAFSGFVVGHEEVLFVAEFGIVSVGDPLLLDKLELPGEAGVERHEDDAAVDCVEGFGVLAFDGVLWWRGRTVRQTTPGDAPAMNEPALKAEGIARIHAADMCAERAF